MSDSQISMTKDDICDKIVSIVIDDAISLISSTIAPKILSFRETSTLASHYFFSQAHKDITLEQVVCYYLSQIPNENRKDMSKEVAEMFPEDFQSDVKCIIDKSIKQLLLIPNSKISEMKLDVKSKINKENSIKQKSTIDQIANQPMRNDSKPLRQEIDNYSLNKPITQKSETNIEDVEVDGDDIIKVTKSVGNLQYSGTTSVEAREAKWLSAGTNSSSFNDRRQDNKPTLL